MSLKSSLIILSCFYFLLAFLCLLYLPNFDSYITEEEHEPKAQDRKHRHIRVHEWLLQRCANLTSPTASTVQSVELQNWFYFVSAYYDTRKDLSHFVRILAAVRQGKRKDEMNVHCHVPLGPQLYFTVPAAVYKMNENHGMPVGAFIFSCPLPPHLQVSTTVCSVRITNGPDPVADPDGRKVQAAELPVLTVPRQQRRQFTVCLPALFGSVGHTKLMDFVEMSRALGAEHFVFYKTDEIDSQQPLSQLLRQYEQRGLATVFRWRAVNRFRSLIHYHGQMLSVHHCLYWNMGVSKYVMFQDFDELLVPNQQKYDSWQKMMSDIDTGAHCGFRFFSSFFNPELGYFDAKRTAGVSRVRTKCMVRPDLIFEMGIHHISKQNVEEMTPENKEPDTALLHHYKQCTMAFETSPNLCGSSVRDSSLHFWKQKFMELKLETVHRLNSM